MITIELPAQSSVALAEISKAGVTRFLNRARSLVGIQGAVEVLLTSDVELKRLNRTFRGKNKATDVLSFPTPPEIAREHAGDLAISLEAAARQAAAYGHTLQAELRILMLHGLLHLHGLDHEADTGEMAARETALRTRLRLPAALLERAGKPATQPATSSAASFSAAKHRPRA